MGMGKSIAGSFTTIALRILCPNDCLFIVESISVECCEGLSMRSLS